MIDTLHGDCLTLLPTLDAGSVQTIVTSPPYWRMRQYTDDPREIGQEPTPAEYVAALVAVFRECRRVLRADGTLWLNLGDAYANDGKWGGSTGGKHAGGLHGQQGPGRKKVSTGLPPKSLIGLPWRVAFGLQDDGWVLRNDIIWHKPNAMPRPVTDRCITDHEYVFLFAKQGHYYYDHLAVTEPATDYTPHTKGRQRGVGGRHDAFATPIGNVGTVAPGLRNARTVWSINTEALADEHYAPMPQTLAERCIKAGCRPGDTVLDPFGGSGTTGRAAVALGRRAVLIDLGYQELQARRTDGVQMRLDALEAA
jgi:DNA modification methylase